MAVVEVVSSLYAYYLVYLHHLRSHRVNSMM